MLNRLIRVAVVLLSFILIVPALALQIFAFIFFNYNIVSIIVFIFIGACDDDNWNYKTFLNYVN